MQAWLSWSERGTVNSWVFNLIMSKTKNSNSHGFELRRPSIKGTKLLLKAIKAIIITPMCLTYSCCMSHASECVLYIHLHCARSRPFTRLSLLTDPPPPPPHPRGDAGMMSRVSHLLKWCLGVEDISSLVQIMAVDFTVAVAVAVAVA